MVDHSSASEHNDFTRCLSLFDSAFPQILSLLGMPAPTQLSPDTFYYSLDKARERLGNWSSVAARFNYNEQEMASFLAALRTLNKWLGRNTDGQPADRNLTIAALRFLWQLEYLREKQPQLTYSTTLHNEGEEKQLRSLQQVRALELTIRSLINEAYNNQQALLEHLNKLFGQERVKKWLNVADRDDVLSGTLFSELASLFIDKDEYPIHYSPLYQYTPLLSFVNDKRRTLNTFLDDIRVIRNRLAHHKRVTSVQTTLVNYYYQEITEPVQEAFDEGRVKVNPDRFFDDRMLRLLTISNRQPKKLKISAVTFRK